MIKVYDVQKWRWTSKKGGQDVYGDRYTVIHFLLGNLLNSSLRHTSGHTERGGGGGGKSFLIFRNLITHELWRPTRQDENRDSKMLQSCPVSLSHLRVLDGAFTSLPGVSCFVTLRHSASTGKLELVVVLSQMYFGQQLDCWKCVLLVVRLKMCFSSCFIDS